MIGTKSDVGTATTFEGIPAAPAAAVATSITASSIAFKWEPPTTTNGDITGYAVLINGEQLGHGSGSATTTIGAGPAADNDANDDEVVGTVGEATFLAPNTEYTITIQAFTLLGGGPASPPLAVRTAAGLPGAVAPPTAVLNPVEERAAAVALEWFPPKLLPAPNVTMYTVYQWMVDVTASAAADGTVEPTVIFSGSEHSHTATNLQPCTVYMFAVQAHTTAGAGPTGTSAQISTGSGLPLQALPAPTVLGFEGGGFDVLVVGWDTRTACDATSYHVNHWFKGSNPSDQPDRLHVTLVSLRRIVAVLEERHLD
jgi:hypothetical protein